MNPPVEEFARTVRRAASFLSVRYGAPLWLVGSALTGDRPRDWDVRVYVPDEWAELYLGPTAGWGADPAPARPLATLTEPAEWELARVRENAKRSAEWSRLFRYPVDFQVRRVWEWSADAAGDPPRLRLSSTEEVRLPRPDWDTYFIALARLAATRGTCPRTRVGCVLVSPAHRVLATGYNGGLPGAPHCTEAGCLLDPAGHCARAVHAEQNAVLSAAAGGAGLVGATAYVTHHPCPACYRALRAVRVARIAYAGDAPTYAAPAEQELAARLHAEGGLTPERLLP